MARSSPLQSAGGTTAIVGKAITWAPRAARRSANSAACSRGRVMRTVVPNSGRDSNQLSFSRSRTTSPTTMTVGGSSFAASAFFTISASVPTMVFCSARVPHRINATGVLDGRPEAVRCVTMEGRFFMPIRNTTVPLVDASRSHSTVGDGFSGSSWPVTSATLEASVRWVTGMPA